MRRPPRSKHVSMTMTPGRPRPRRSFSSTRTTRPPGIDRPTSIATHSREQSSTTLNVRKVRPSPNVSAMKSIDQGSFGASGIGSASREAAATRLRFFRRTESCSSR
jgi:hypothetical protein